MAESADELFGELVQIMARLRGENGCPWDRQQTHESIKPYFVEETYEVLEAIDEGDAGKLREELGDVMLQVVFHARMAEEAGSFGIGDVLRRDQREARPAPSPRVRRRPGRHRPGGPVQLGADQEDGAAKTPRARLPPGRRPAGTAGAPPRPSAAGEGLPGRLRLEGGRARCSQKVEEELGELRAAMESEQAERMEAELGDLLFSLVNLSRFIAVNPEEALRKTIARFIARFRFIEEELTRRGRTPGR